jgi:hypothetical protein
MVNKLQADSRQAQVKLIGFVRVELLRFAKLVQAEFTILVVLAQLVTLVELAQLAEPVEFAQLAILVEQLILDLLLGLILLATFIGLATLIALFDTFGQYCQLLLQPNQVLL